MAKTRKVREAGNAPTTSAQELIDRGDYKTAIDVLKQDLAANPTDEIRRRLADCWSRLGKYDKALEQMSLVDQNDPFNILFKGWLLYDKEDLKGAQDCFQQFILLIPASSSGYYWLGRTYDHWKFEGKEKRRLATESYRKAIACDGCRPDAFLRLAARQPWNDAGHREKLKLLTDAMAKHPDSEEVRLALSYLYIRALKQPQEGLDVVRPLLDGTKVSASALWRAYCASKDLSRYGDAKQFLLTIPAEKIREVPREMILGDLELLAGDFESAFQSFSAAMEASAPRIRVLLSFGRADALLASGKMGPAISEARLAAFGLLETVDDEFYFDGPVFIDSEPEAFDATRSLVVVCKRLLGEQNHGVGEGIDPEMRGALAFALYKTTGLDDEERDTQLLAASSSLSHPAMASDLEQHSFTLRDFAAGIHHHVTHCRWLIRKGKKIADVRSIYAPIYERPVDLKITKKECTSIVAAFMEELTTAHGKREVQSIFLPTYQFVRDSLRANELHADMLEPATALLKLIPEAEGVLWDQTYAYHCRKNNEAAERGYRLLLKADPNDTAAMHNLSMLLEERGELVEALALSQTAAGMSPKDKTITGWHTRLQSHKEEQEKEKASREDFLRTAVQRWPRLDGYKRQLACTLSLIRSYQGLDHLAKLSGIDEKYLQGHLRKLEEEGILLHPKPHTFELNPHVRPLIERESSHAVITKLIRGDDSIAFRPIFNCRQEYTVYSILISLFPNHLVFPNMALQAVFQYARMNSLLDPDEFRFFLNSLVDFCVISTANYLPLIGFEVDSRFHDDEDQKARDAKKEKVFRVGGVSLLRLRGYGNPTAAATRGQIVQEVRSLGQLIRQATQKSAVLNTLEREVDFDSFGTLDGADDSRRWVTVSQAASISGCNPGMISRAADAGELMGNGMVDRQRRIDVVDLGQWMLRRTPQSSGEESAAQVQRLVNKHVTD